VCVYVYLSTRRVNRIRQNKVK